MASYCSLLSIKKVTRQQIYGMPTGSVIVRFGLSYPRIFILSWSKIVYFLELRKIFISFLKKIEVNLLKKPSDCIASFFLEMPLSMHLVALILQNCFSKSTFFCNFGRNLKPSLFIGSLGANAIFEVTIWKPSDFRILPRYAYW